MGRPSSRPGARSAGGPAASVLGEDEALAVAAGLLDDEHGEAPVGQRPVRVGAGQQHEHVGPGGEGAPGLDPVDHPPAVDGRGRRHDAGHVGAEVGLGHRHGGQDLGRGQLGQPVLLLLLGPAVDQRPGQDLGPGDERAADAERAPAQLLGGDHHAHVVALAARREPAVLLGDREPEAAELGQALDDLFGDVAVGRGGRARRAGRPSPRRSGGTSRAPARSPRPGGGALGAGQAGQHRRVALRRRGRRPPASSQPGSTPQSASRPATLPARSATTSATKAAAMRASTSPCAPYSSVGPGRGHRGRGVGHVVGDDLVGVDAAAPADGGAGLVDQVVGPGRPRRRRRRGPGEWASSRGATLLAGPTGPCPARSCVLRPRRPITVTSGGRTTGSSPGSTPVSDSR